MPKRVCPKCGDISDVNFKICPHCSNDFEKSEEITKDEAIKFLRKISFILVIIGIIGIIFGWMAVGAFGFLFLPFVFWEKLGRIIRTLIKEL